MQAAKYGFRIVGSCRETRRLVDAAAAFLGYADCDNQAEVKKEAYLSAFQFGAEFRSHLELTGSTKGYSGPCWAAWLWFDVDREGDLDAATVDTRRLAANLADRYTLDGEELLIFFSGSKGYHVGLPTALWRPPPSVAFHKLARRFAENIAERAGVKIDTGVYDKVRAFRAPNSRHPKTGRHKRWLSFDELMNLKTSAIVALAATPSAFAIPSPPALNAQAINDWKQAAKQIAEQTEANQQRRLERNGAAGLNRTTLEFVRDGAAAGDRHRLLFSAAANLAEFGCPPSLAHALLTEPALDVGLAPKEVARVIECGLSANAANATPQHAPESPNAAGFDSEDAQADKRNTGDPRGSQGHICQQLTRDDQ